MNANTMQPVPGNGSHNGAHSETVVAPSATFAPDDIRRMLLANVWLLAGFIAATTITGFAVNSLILRYWPTYTASAMLKIQRVQLLNPVTEKTSELAERDLDIEQRTQARLLSDARLFSDVLKSDPKLRACSWFKQFQSTEAGTGRLIVDIPSAKRDLSLNFKVSPLGNSPLLAITMTASRPEDAKLIIEAIVQQHLRQQSKELNDAQSLQTRTLRDLARTLGTRINETSERVRGKWAGLLREGLSGPGVAGTREIELRALVDMQFKISGAAADARQIYERTRQLAQRGDPIPEVEKAVDADAAIATLNQQITTLQVRRDTSSGELGPGHHDLVQLDRAIHAVATMMDARRKELRSRYQAQLLDAQKTASEQAAEQAKLAADQVKTCKAQLAELAQEVPPLTLDQQEETRLRELREQVDGRLRDMELAQNLGGALRLSWAYPPEIPDEPNVMRAPALLAACLMLGLGLGVGLVLLREVINRTVRSPMDLKRTEMLGIVADARDDAQAAESRLVMLDAPQSLMAEQYRHIWANLQRAISRDPCRTILVTSASPAAGATTVAANLAAAMAMSGQRVLLVDANLHRPGLHELFDLPLQSSLAETLLSQTPAVHIARIAALANLYVLPGVAPSGRPANVVSGQAWDSFCDKVVTGFDVLVVDSAPILVAAETSAMASRFGGVVTVARAQVDTRGQLQRMHDLLAGLGARHLGTILNAVRVQRGGYYRDAIKAHYDYRTRPDALTDSPRVLSAGK